MIHSTWKVLLFFVISIESLTTSSFLCHVFRFLSINVVIFLKSGTLNTLFVLVKGISEIRFTYCTKRLLATITRLSWENTANPSRENCKWLNNFSFSIDNSSLVFRRFLYIRIILWVISPMSFFANFTWISTGLSCSAFCEKSCKIEIDLLNLLQK